MPFISIITDRKHGRNTCVFFLHSNRTVNSDIEGEEMYDDMLTTDQMIQMLEEDDSDKEFLGFYYIVLNN